MENFVLRVRAGQTKHKLYSTRNFLNKFTQTRGNLGAEEVGKAKFHVSENAKRAVYSHDVDDVGKTYC